MRNIIRGAVFFLCLFATVIPAFAQDPLSATFPSVFANEASARLALQEKSSIFSIELSAKSSKVQPATLFVRMVAPDEKLLAEGSVSVSLSSAAKRAEIPLKWIPLYGLQDAATSRLLYEVHLNGSDTAAVTGILSPYSLIADLFELRFIGLEAISPDRTYAARVWATRPDSHRPVAGVELSGWLGEESEENTESAGLRARARTNSRGEALLTFHIPTTSVSTDDETGVDIEIHGIRGGFQNAVTAGLKVSSRAAILLSTDKPLYQPDQELHMRALLLDHQHHAWDKQPVRFVVRDPDASVVFSTESESSHFGVASADWAIPSSQKMGNYQVSAEISGNAGGRELMGGQVVRITRYELPTFTVNVATNQPYYLPGQNADVTVSGRYLFGKPVLRGHVRIVRESTHNWNYREQKWEGEEVVASEGDLDANNEFHTTLSKPLSMFYNPWYVSSVQILSTRNKQTSPYAFKWTVSQDRIYPYHRMLAS